MATNDKERIRALEEDVANLEKELADVQAQLRSKDAQFQQYGAQQDKAVKLAAYQAGALGVPDYGQGPTVKTLNDGGNWVNKDQKPDTMNQFWIERMGFDNPALGGKPADEAD